MTERTDEHLRQLLQRADPRRGALLDDTRRRRITARVLSQEDPMSQQTLTPQPAPADDLQARRRRRHRALGGAAAGLVAAAAAAALVIPGLGDGPTEPAPQAAEPLVLTAPDGEPGGPAASCAVVTAAALRDATRAFEATVVSADDEVALLDVTTTFQGDAVERVELPQSQTSAGPDEFSAGRLVEGESYLISTVGSQLAVCGQSGPATGELRDLYERAFTR